MADWQPILAAHETELGHWYLIDGLGKPYGQIRLVKRGDQVGYRADRCDDRGELTGVVGYYPRGFYPTLFRGPKGQPYSASATITMISTANHAFI
jgi:hypothetical protein